MIIINYNNIRILLYPTKEEEELSCGIVTFVFSSRRRNNNDKMKNDNNVITAQDIQK